MCDKLNLKHPSQWLFRKSNFLFGISLLLFFIFNQLFTIVIDNTLVNYVFRYAQYSTYWKDCLLIVIAIGIVIFYLPKRKDYIPSGNITAVLLLLLIFYSYYRFYNSQWWNFTPFKICSSFKYLDVLALIPIVNIVLWVIDFAKCDSPVIDKTKNQLFDDTPINKNDNDILGYRPYAKMLAEKIEGSQFEKSLAIGINGHWGIGKTSFLNLIESNLKKEDKIFVPFNAWSSQNHEAIIQDFFEILQEKVRPYHSSLARKLTEYSHKLLKLNDGVISNTINIVTSAITGFESIDSLNKDIDVALKTINKKLIVFIDDLDRLEAKEIAEILKLIRNTANFHNTFFIVAYDRGYIVNAIKELNTHKPHSYLEKIFQIEITLPYIDKSIFKNKLIELIIPNIKPEFHNDARLGIIGEYFAPTSYLDNWITSMRDVTRLANSIVLNYTKLQGEVDFSDFLQLEVLRLKYPGVYELIFRRTKQFLDTEKNSGEFTYCLKTISSKENQSKYKYELEKELNEKNDENLIPKSEIEKVISFINTIFPASNVVFTNSNKLSVVYPSNFLRYFAYDLLNEDLSEVDFSKARQSSLDEFKVKIDKWVDNGLQIKLRERFEKIQGFDNKEDFEKTISTIFYLANKDSVAKDYPSTLVGFKADDIKNKLFNYNNSIVDKYYNYLNGENDFRTFFFSLLEPGKYPYTFEASLLSEWLRHWYEEDTKPFTKQDAERVVVNYLNDYAEKEKKFTQHFWFLYRSCFVNDWIGAPQGTLTAQGRTIEKANDIVKELAINYDFDGFIRDIISYGRMGDSSVTVDHSFIIKVWKSLEEFETILGLITSEKSKSIEEFRTLYSELKKANFGNINFTFKTIEKRK